MPEYTRMLTVDTSPDDSFAYLNDPQNWSVLFPFLRSVSGNGEKQLVISPKEEGPTFTLRVRFEADSLSRRLQWSAIQAPRYTGSVSITASDDGSIDATPRSDIVIHLVVPELPQQFAADQYLGEGLHTLRERLSRSPVQGEPTA
jgi:hypothetical protein